MIREEVSVHKQVEHDTVETSETLRKEELAIDTDNQTVVEKK